MNRAALTELARLIGRYRFNYATEDALQEGLAVMLTGQGYEVEREVRIVGRRRIDLLTGDVGIEVKIDGRVADVRRQLARYARSERVGSLLLVTNRVRHVSLNGIYNHKPLLVVPIVHP